MAAPTRAPPSNTVDSRGAPAVPADLRDNTAGSSPGGLAVPAVPEVPTGLTASAASAPRWLAVVPARGRPTRLGQASWAASVPRPLVLLGPTLLGAR